MKKNIANKWIKALRSGKYKQGTGSLKTKEGKYCCLGVLCEITKKEHGFKNYLTMTNGEGSINSTLPIKIVPFTGMKSTSGELKFKGRYERLSALNDDGVSFEEIADIIQENWKKL